MYSLKSLLCQPWNVLQTLSDTAFAYAISWPRITFALYSAYPDSAHLFTSYSFHMVPAKIGLFLGFLLSVFCIFGFE